MRTIKFRVRETLPRHGNDEHRQRHPYWVDEIEYHNGIAMAARVVCDCHNKAMAERIASVMNKGAKPWRNPSQPSPSRDSSMVAS